MCSFRSGLTIRTHDPLNREIVEFHKGMGFSTTSVVKSRFQSANDPDVRSGLPFLSIKTTISEVCSDQSLKNVTGKPARISGSRNAEGNYEDCAIHGRMQKHNGNASSEHTKGKVSARCFVNTSKNAVFRREQISRRSQRVRWE